VGEFHFDPTGYLERIRDELPAYDELQERVAAATEGVDARRILDLGAGTGETARRVLERHPGARLVATDVSGDMLERARLAVPEAELVVCRLEDGLPDGAFDLVVSALAVHHLDADAKRDLFRRAFAALPAGGRFVLGDVVVPERPEDAVAPLTPGYDRPDPARDQLAWLRETGFDARLAWQLQDLALLVADHP
jgi:tRNA (cmo5U34)-methyltransferase